jgi:hypothetical protein
MVPQLNWKEHLSSHARVLLIVAPAASMVGLAESWHNLVTEKLQ